MLLRDGLEPEGHPRSCLIMVKGSQMARNPSSGSSVYRQIIPTEGRVSERATTYRPLRPQTHPKGQLDLDLGLQGGNRNGFRDPAFADNKAQPVHRWVPWIAGFSSQFVEGCFDTFLKHKRRASRPYVLDPFAGVGTTLVRALLSGFNTVGFEINPYAALASKVKLNSPKINLAKLEACCQEYQKASVKRACPVGTHKPADFRSRIPFFSPHVEEQVLAFFGFLNSIPDPDIADIFRVAFGSVMVSFSNYTYEPSLGSRPGAGKPLIEDADVHSTILAKLHQMIVDIRWVKEEIARLGSVGDGQIYNLDFMESGSLLPAGSIDLMVTSPPYMNNYHYVRNTRPQLFWLSLISSPKDLRRLEEANFGKYWQTVRDSEPLYLSFEHPALSRALEELRETRREKGACGGPGWANYVTSYFNDCCRFLRTLKHALIRGGVGVIVIGNSIIQGHEIKTDLIIGDIAQQVGLELEGVQCIRTKRVGASITQSTVRRGQTNSSTLYESAVIVRKK